MKVGALYSKGPHYLRMLAHLRSRYPKAELIALVPEGYPEEVLAGRCDRIITTPPSRGPGALFPLLRILRAERLDIFCVMFHSARLQVVSALSGARETMCYTAGGQYFRVRYDLAPQLSHWVYRQIRGRLLYARIWWEVRTTKVDTET
jgi:hypothetical protein